MLPVAAVVGVFIFLISLNSHLNERSLHDLSVSLVHIHVTEETVASLIGNVNKANGAERAFYMTGDRFYIRPFILAESNAATDLHNLSSLCANSPNQMRRLEAVKPLVRAKMHILDRSIRANEFPWIRGAIPLELSTNQRDMVQINGAAMQIMQAEEAVRQTQEVAAMRRDRAAMWLDGLDLLTVIVLLSFSTALTLNGSRQRSQALRDLEESLHASEESAAFIDTAMHALHDGLIVTDSAGTVHMCNGSAERILQLSRDQIMEVEPLPERWCILDEDGSEYPPEMHNLSSILEAGLFQRGVVLCIRLPDDTFRWVRVNADTLRVASGTHGHGSVATLADVTPQKLLENELRKNELQLQESNQALESQKQQLESANKELATANHELETLATRDGLTGLMNHRSFQARLREEVRRAQRYHKPFALILMDVDKFKEFNDKFGHPAGDEVLKKVAHLLSVNARSSDSVARYGGEEFVVLLPDTTLDGADQMAERMRLALANTGWPLREVTGSFGICDWDVNLQATEMIERADKAMYESKKNGRNRVSVFRDDQEPTLRSA